MHSQWEIITAPAAREMLLTARCGRKPSQSVIERYARDMMAGRWRDSPEGLVFDGEGTGKRVLRDGQQRAFAIRRAAIMLHEAGKLTDPDEFEIRLYVTQGTTEEIDRAFPYLNTGKGRTGNDYLAIEGRSNPTLLHTVGRRIALWNAGHVTGNAFKPTRAEVLAILEMQDDSEEELLRVAAIEEAAQFASDWSVKPPVPAAGVAGFLHWLLGRVDPAARDTFLEYLRTGNGEELTATRTPGEVHPLELLRSRLHGDLYEARRRGTSVRQETVIYLCLRGWEAWRRGEHPKKYQMPVKLGDGSFKMPR